MVYLVMPFSNVYISSEVKWKTMENELYKYGNLTKNGLLKLKEADPVMYEDMLNFLRTLQMNNYSEGRMYKYVCYFRNIGKILNKNITHITKDNIETF